MAISNIIKTSLGPVGLDKMLVDEIGDVTITNDGATILAQLDIEHPAAKVLVELAQLQDQEVGDGTTSVVIIAAELLRRANELVKNNIHPTVVMAGYRLAVKEAVKYVKSNLVVNVDTLGRNNLLAAAKTSMSSKIIGSESDFFANLAVTAATRVKIEKDGKVKCPIGNVHVLKSHGQSALDSELVDGFALNCARASSAMPTRITNVKVALLDFNLQKHKLQMGVQVRAQGTLCYPFGPTLRGPMSLLLGWSRVHVVVTVLVPHPQPLSFIPLFHPSPSPLAPLFNPSPPPLSPSLTPHPSSPPRRWW